MLWHILRNSSYTNEQISSVLKNFQSTCTKILKNNVFIWGKSPYLLKNFYKEFFFHNFHINIKILPWNFQQSYIILCEIWSYNIKSTGIIFYHWSVCTVILLWSIKHHAQFCLNADSICPDDVTHHILQSNFLKIPLFVWKL